MRGWDIMIERHHVMLVKMNLLPHSISNIIGFPHPFDHLGRRIFQSFFFEFRKEEEKRGNNVIATFLNVNNDVSVSLFTLKQKWGIPLFSRIHIHITHHSLASGGGLRVHQAPPSLSLSLFFIASFST